MPIADLRVWLGPWQWQQDDVGDNPDPEVPPSYIYAPPAGAKNLIDLRPLEKQAVGGEEGLSLFVTTGGARLGSEYREMGGFDDAVDGKVWRSVFGVQAAKAALWENIRALVLEQSVPGSRNPLQPIGRRLSFVVPGEGKWQQQLPRLTTRTRQQWEPILQSMRLSIAAQADAEEDDNRTGKRELASKFLAVRAKQLGISHAEAMQLLVPARLQDKLADRRPETSADDYFNYGGGTPWGQVLGRYRYQSGGQSFHYGFGQGAGWGISGVGVGGGVHIFFRWSGTALSSTDQSGRCSWRYRNAANQTTRAGVMLRSDAFGQAQSLDLTAYMGYIGTPSNICRPDIGKVVSGTISFVQQGTTGESYNSTLTRPIDFSAIGSDLELVAASETGGANQTISVTDTSITTGLNVGVYQFSGGSNSTPFAIPGAYDYANNRGFEWEDVEAEPIEISGTAPGPAFGGEGSLSISDPPIEISGTAPGPAFGGTGTITVSDPPDPPDPPDDDTGPSPAQCYLVLGC